MKSLDSLAAVWPLLVVIACFAIHVFPFAEPSSAMKKVFAYCGLALIVVLAVLL